MTNSVAPQGILQRGRTVWIFCAAMGVQIVDVCYADVRIQMFLVETKGIIAVGAIIVPEVNSGSVSKDDCIKRRATVVTMDAEAKFVPIEFGGLHHVLHNKLGGNAREADAGLGVSLSH